MDNIQHLAILGSTGSIGTQTLDVVSRYPDNFKVDVLTANENTELLASQAVAFGADDVVICNPSRCDDLKARLAGTGIRIHSGMDAVCNLVQQPQVDTVVGAMVGFSGLRPVISALQADKTVALANKETLVAGGSIVDSIVRSGKGRIIPVDSEHSAIFQCLQAWKDEKLSRIHLTASGGPFRTWTKEEISRACAADALRHPNWNMGAKVTIDSATMMNKGLEVIEAKWLFGVDVDRINVVVHPQSVVHSMVEFEDGAVIAQLGTPDMRQPIQYALTFPHRMPLNNRKLNFAELGSIDFFAPDMEKFPCLALVFEAIRSGGTAPAVMNAANEIAVKAFLEGRTGIYGIAEVIRKTMDGIRTVQAPSLEEIFDADIQARAFAETLI